jgi:TPP-dependent trihydroxycyclohexane-1,2-dione (THcHDO) dehydratase
MQDRRQHQLLAFVEWVGQHLAGDEKGEAQLFLDRLLQAFGHGGVKEAGATLEKRVKSRDRKHLAQGALAYDSLAFAKTGTLVPARSNRRLAHRRQRRFESVADQRPRRFGVSIC